MPLYRRFPKRGFNNTEFSQKKLKLLISKILNGSLIMAQGYATKLLIEKGLIKIGNSIKKSVSTCQSIGAWKLTKKLNVTC